MEGQPIEDKALSSGGMSLEMKISTEDVDRVGEKEHVDDGGLGDFVNSMGSNSFDEYCGEIVDCQSS